MNKTYRWEIPKTFCEDESSKTNYSAWIRTFSEQLCYVFAKGLREKLGFTDDNYNFSQDDLEYAIEFDESETVFVVNFGFEREEAGTLIFEVFINAIKLKKILFFYRRSEPPKEVFEKFHDVVMTIAKENNILLIEEA